MLDKGVTGAVPVTFARNPKMTTESLKDKIAKLLAKAEGTDNPHEAASFMEKVNALLEENQIELHEIRARMGNKADADPIIKAAGETNLYASMIWARGVAGALARYYGCRIVYWKVGNHFKYDVVGRQSATVTFELMLPFVITQVKLQARKLDAGVYNAKSRSVLERQVGQALQVRIARMIHEAEAHRVVLTGKGLIPFDNMDEMLKVFFPAVKTGKAKPISLDRDAVAAANNISLNVQATHAKAKQLR
jgi:hypothetical protein